jgi:hypothetical protein
LGELAGDVDTERVDDRDNDERDERLRSGNIQWQWRRIHWTGI